MEKIFTALETIESNTARMFGLEDERTQIVFMLTDSLRTVFVNEEAIMKAKIEEKENKKLSVEELAEKSEEEQIEYMSKLSEKELDTLARETLCKMFETMLC